MEVAISRHLFPFEVAIESKSQRRDLQFPVSVSVAVYFKGEKEQKQRFISNLNVSGRIFSKIYPKLELQTIHHGEGP